jgi:hypothetical protein
MEGKWRKSNLKNLALGRQLVYLVFVCEEECFAEAEAEDDDGVQWVGDHKLIHAQRSLLLKDIQDMRDLWNNIDNFDDSYLPNYELIWL